MHIRSFPSAVDNETTGEWTPGTPQDDAWPTTPKLGYRRDLINGETIKEDDMLIVIAAIKVDGTALPVVPVGGTHEIVFDKGDPTEEVWKVIDTITHSGGDLPAAYEIQLRKS